MPLTDTAARNARPRNKMYKMADAGGLYLEVRPNGSKLWRYRYRIAGKENLFALGEYAKAQHAGHVSVDAAREAMREAKKLVKQGIHPAHHRRANVAQRIAENANTFEAIASEWIENKRVRWSPYYAKQVDRAMKADVFPFVGGLPIKSVTAQHVLDIVRRAEKRDAKVVALLLRQWCSAIFRYATMTLRAEGDPAAAVRGAIERPKTKSRKPLAPAAIAEFAQ